jgi:hypothetical protein
MRRKRFNRYNYNRTASDMSASSIILTLVLLGTIVAGHTDHPVFWLLVGPAPLGIGFTAMMVLFFVTHGVAPLGAFFSVPQNQLWFKAAKS